MTIPTSHPMIRVISSHRAVIARPRRSVVSAAEDLRPLVTAWKKQVQRSHEVEQKSVKVDKSRGQRAWARVTHGDHADPW